MKLLIENWRLYLEEMGDLQNVIVTVNDDGKLVIPPSGNAEIDIIVSEILSTLEPSDLKGKYKKLHKEKKCNKLTGHCFVATEVFWELTKRLEKNYNYVPCFIKHRDEEGKMHSHWFAKNLSNGHVVDLTAGQFETIPDYNLGKCDTEEKASASRYMMRRKDPYDPGKTTPTKRTLDVLSRMDDKE
tara:strand:+ start:12 stop:569 length:558 start_codon:yes stop_codon:yes gene_type:complete